MDGDGDGRTVWQLKEEERGVGDGLMDCLGLSEQVSCSISFSISFTENRIWVILNMFRGPKHFIKF